MSSHKDRKSDADGVQQVFYYFRPGLPVSFTLCPVSHCGALSQMVGVRFKYYLLF